ncbi:MAG: type 4a pilus biogenesis protein PilO [Acidimicrobiia bacterium]|nr:type 4a pilus biogenesis protein PilO [Acidimicrobiia bacterium]
MRRVSIFVALAVLLATVAWWFFLIGPRNATIADLEDERFVAVDTEQRLRVQIRQLQDIRDREVEYAAAVGRLDALIPDRPRLEEFIEQVYALAGETGVDLQSLSPSVPAVATEGTDLRQISVSAQIEGEFFEILGFLFGLSDMERLVRVDGVALSSSTTDDGTTVLSASLELQLFTLADLLPIEVPADEGTGGGSTDTTAPTSIPEATP